VTDAQVAERLPGPTPGGQRV